MQILTPNLRLVPDTLDRLMTLFDGADVFEKKFGVRVAAGITETYRDVPRAGLAAVVSACAVAGWILGFSIEHAEDNTLIGSCAFKGPPDSKRAVEIAYFVAPGYRGRGFAGEAARALVAHGFETGRVAIVRAHTLPDDGSRGRARLALGDSRRSIRVTFFRKRVRNG